MKNNVKIYLLRFIHTIFSLYFIACLVYLYIAAIENNFNILLAVVFFSLATEGFVVYVVNNGDCPLTNIQHKLGDKVPFFELFFPKKRLKVHSNFFQFLPGVASFF